MSPPYAATMPLTTEIGPIRSPVKYGEVGAGADEPEERGQRRATPDRSADACRSTSAERDEQTALDELHAGRDAEAADDAGSRAR